MDRKRINITLNVTTVDALGRVAEAYGAKTAGIASWILETAVRSSDFSTIEGAMVAAGVRAAADREQVLKESEARLGAYIALNNDLKDCGDPELMKLFKETQALIKAGTTEDKL